MVVYPDMRHVDAVGSWRRRLLGGCMSVFGSTKYLHFEVDVANAQPE